MIPDTKLVSDYFSNAFRDKQALIIAADSKANILLGIIGVILSLFFKLFSSNQLYEEPVLIFIVVPFLIAGAFAFTTLFPRLSKKSNGFSLLYFHTARAVGNDELFQKSPEELSTIIYEDYIKNIKILSGIVAKKFFYLRLAYIFFGLGIILKLSWEIFLLLS